MSFPSMATSYEYKKKEYPENLITAIGADTCIPLTKDQENGLLFAMNFLKEREQRIIKMRFMENRTYGDIGKELGLSPERIRQIIVKSLYRLRRPLIARYYKEGLSKVMEREGMIDEAIKLASKADLPENRKKLLGEFADVAIDELRMSTRATNLLIRADADTIWKMMDLIYDRPRAFVSMRNLGEKTAKEILKRIADTGTSLPSFYEEYDWQELHFTGTFRYDRGLVAGGQIR